jgi:hypothetical protein
MKYGLFYEGKLLSGQHTYDSIKNAIEASIQIVGYKRRVQGYSLYRLRVKPLKRVVLQK